jgi:LacI family transcriptional regulator
MSYPRGHRVTIIDVAKEANVSAGTVSNALTGKRPVADTTRQRILAVIEELGYQPNLLARGLVNRTSKTLGVVAAGLEYYGPSRTLVGIEEEANVLGYSLLLDLLHRPDAADVKSVLNDLAARRVDGIIWAVHEIGNNRAWLQDEVLLRLPPIVFLTMEARRGVPVINTDNRAGAYMATRHLVEAGRKVIGLITGPLEWWEARERQLGWESCLLEAGLPADRALAARGDWSPPSGEEALTRLLTERPDIDAVFASNDQMALGALRAAERMGRRVPDDLAMVGFDNIPESAFFWPPLTTVRQRLRELGRAAVRELETFIRLHAAGDSYEGPEPRRLMPELIVRESSGAAR